MVGDVAAPVGADQGRTEVVGVSEDVVERPPQAEGEDVRVLEQEQVGVGGPLEQRPLEGVGVGELRPPQPPGPEHGRSVRTGDDQRRQSAAKCHQFGGGHSSWDQSRVSRISWTRAMKADA